MPQMSGAPYPVRLAGLDLRMSPLQDRDYDELTNWMRSNVVSTARASLTDDMDPEERRELLGAAVDTASRMQFGDPKHMSYFRSPSGVARMYWKGFVHNHPSLTPERVLELIQKDPEGLAEASRVFVELNFQKKRDKAVDQAGPVAGEGSPDSPEQGGDLRDAGEDAQDRG